jgi:iron complex transport system permease protein
MLPMPGVLEMRIIYGMNKTHEPAAQSTRGQHQGSTANDLNYSRMWWLRGGKVPASHRFKFVLLLSLIILLLSAVLALCFGPVKLTSAEVVRTLFSHGDSVQSAIIWQIRMPRILLAALVGGALASSGTGFQSLLRNDLADPYILGISSGASSAVAFVSIFHLTARYPAYIAPAAAFLGALLVLILVLSLSSKNGRVDSRSLLLNGVIVSAFLGALELAGLRFAGFDAEEILNWLMGTLSPATWQDCGLLSVIMVLCVGVMMVVTPSMNLYSVGEESARQLGLDAETFKRILVVASTILAACTVSLVGIIGFIGLIAPHVARRLLNTPDHRYTLPVAIVCGAILLLWSDTLARTLLGGDMLPVGVVTAFLGAPFFCFQLRRR